MFRLEIQNENKCWNVDNGWIGRIETGGDEIDFLVILRVWKILHWFLQNLVQNSMLLRTYDIYMSNFQYFGL